jgi:outer membrane receptor protein involved in Fe transport
MISRVQLSSACRRVKAMLPGTLVPFALFTLSAQAQTSAGANAASTETDTVTLSPFVVRDAKDNGFVANSALAGGRLATSLKDTPVAYSVLTRDFIEALNLSDVTTATMWATNAYINNDNGNQTFFGNETPIYFRGAPQNLMRRNFFEIGSGIVTDSYNIERYDYGRGPNAVLFGSGSFSGTSNLVTRQAIIGKSSDSVTAQYGSWSTKRVTLDANQTNGTNFALREDIVYQNGNGWMDRQWQNRYGGYLAALFRPFAHTDIKASAERYTYDYTNPVDMIADNMSAWDGKTVYSAPLTANPASTTGTARYGTIAVFAPGSGNGGVINYANSGRTTGASTSVGGVAVVGAAPNISGQDMTQELNVPGNRLDVVTANSKFRFPSRTFNVAPDGPAIQRDFADYDATVDQQVGDNLFLHLGGNLSWMHFLSHTAQIRGLTGSTFLDINQNLPNGTPNPNYLVPYNEAPNYTVIQQTFTRELQGAAAYQLNNTRLGDFRFMAMAGGDHNTGEQRVYDYTIERNADPRQWPNGPDKLYYRYYWNQPTRPVTRFASGTVNYTDPVTGFSQNVPVGDVLYLPSYSGVYQTPQTDTYEQAAVTGKVFHGKVDLLAAARFDRYAIRNTISVHPMDYPVNWNGKQIIYRNDAPADYYNLTYTPMNSAGQPTGAPTAALSRPRDAAGNGLAQYANVRFQDDYNPPTSYFRATTKNLGTVVHLTPEYSLAYNYSQTFSPSYGQQLVNGSIIGPGLASGWDATLRANLLGGRLNLSAIYYKANVSNVPVSPFPTANNINTIADANVIGDNSANGINKRGLAEVIGSYYDREKQENHGWEFEAVANLTESLRLTTNVSLPKDYQRDAFQDSIHYLAANDTVFRQILADSGVLIDANNVASVDKSVPSTNQSPDATAAAAAWNNLQAFKASSVTGKQRLLGGSELIANAFVDYTFREGFLKGFRVGGGANYRGRQVIGTTAADTVVNPAAPTTAMKSPNASPYTPVFNHSYVTAVLTLSYKHRINQHLTADFGLTVNNLFDYDKPIYYNTIQRAPNGDITNPGRIATPNNYWYMSPRNYMLTCKLTF